MSREFVINSDNTIDINLRNSTLLEASAGTGKTYSLERIVLNLIRDKKYGLTIKDILVVTFTNKATREMKERIRIILIEEYRKETDLEIRNRLEDAIGSFDEASIFTIHGFCQNTLQTFPFESLSLFSQEINQDVTLLESSVWDYLRHFEASATDSELREFYAFRGNKKFTDVVTELCKLYNRDEFKGQFNYFPGAEDVKDIYVLQNEFDSVKGQLIELINTFKNYNADLMWASSKAMSCATRVTSFQKVHLGFESIVIDDGFFSFMEKLYTKGFCDNLYKLSSQYLESKSKKGYTIDDVDVTSREIILNVDMLFACLEPLFDSKNLTKNPIVSFLSGEFIKKSIPSISELYKIRQEKLGALSYNDLIDNLHSRLMNLEDESLLKAIQNRYKIALIDEFQDTDKKQWDIFSRVFADSPFHNFILIGDPKQSIYGFRGADLEIYYQARETVLEDNRFFLGTNFRSETGIVDGVNRIFDPVFSVKGKGNTAPTTFTNVKDSGKTYRAINDTKQNIEFIVYDEDVKEGKLLSAKECKRGYFRTVINKIVSLLSDSDKVLPGDIAILVENHRDSIILRDSLLNRGVPVVISKQKNVYFSAEANHILSLLKALNRPGGRGELKAVLLSPLFNYSLKEIHQMEELGELEVISTQFLIWSQRLIHSGIISMWEELQAFSTKGHLQTRLLSTINGERAYTNYKHLIENLNDIQRGERLTSLTLYQRLHNLMSSAQEDEENSVRLDRESQAIQIMTIHASKGLEFPVVFFAGGITKPRNSSAGYGIKYADKNSSWTMDFLSGSNSQIYAQRDEWEEKKRLYYVAFTRAANKLYLPLFPNCELTVLSSLYASLDWDQNRLRIEEIADGLLEMCEQPIHNQLKISNAKKAKEIKAALVTKVYDDVLNLAKVNPKTFFINNDYLESNYNRYELKQNSESLTFTDLKSKRGFRHRITWVSSYSGLTKDSHGSVSKEDADREDDEEVIIPVYKKSDEINCFNVPGGATFGDLIHEFFEQVDFGNYNLPLEEFLVNEDVNYIFLSEAKKHFDLEWAKKYGIVSKTMVWNTLNCKLNLDGEMVPLGTFNKENRIHEREFYFRVDSNNKFVSHNLELIVEEGYLKGFIDLIINYNGKLYIADWKTTTIKGEESFNNYNIDRVDKSMNEHNYHLQGLIYTVAIYLHLQKTKTSFDYNSDIGGYFYFYVRGIDPNGQTGISFYKPTEVEVLEFIRELRSDI
ncbi:MAG: UvrD-helicase domain-containing protein [Spirochaetaceae bacterium]